MLMDLCIFRYINIYGVLSVQKKENKDCVQENEGVGTVGAGGGGTGDASGSHGNQ